MPVRFPPATGGHNQCVSDVVLICLGAALILAVLIDAVRTTVSVGDGAGPLTGWLTTLLWRAGLAVHRRRTSHGMLRGLGVVLLLLTVGVWVTMLITGWTFVFSGGERAVVASSDGAAADAIDRVWFTAYTVFSLGNGEFRPEGHAWQLVAVAATATGLSLVTLGVSYLIPVISAVVGRRQLALHIAALGRDPLEIARFAGEHPSAFLQHSVQLVSEIGRVAQQHLAYPVLHYFHAKGPASSAAVAITVLDEAITVLELGVEELPSDVGGAIRPLREAIGQLLHTLQGAFIRAVDEPPPPPELARTDPFPFRLVNDATYRLRVSEGGAHRRLLFGLLRDDGWELTTLDRPLEVDNLR